MCWEWKKVSNKWWGAKFQSHLLVDLKFVFLDWRCLTCNRWQLPIVTWKCRYQALSAEKLKFWPGNYGMYGTVKSIRIEKLLLSKVQNNSEKLITLAPKSLNSISKLRRLGRTWKWFRSMYLTESVADPKNFIWQDKFDNFKGTQLGKF